MKVRSDCAVFDLYAGKLPLHLTKISFKQYLSHCISIICTVNICKTTVAGELR